MIDAIVYSSLSGSCEEYAHRMSAALHVPFFTEQSHICPTGRKVVYIGWLLAGKVVGLNKAKERYNVVWRGFGRHGCSGCQRGGSLPQEERPRR